MKITNSKNLYFLMLICFCLMIGANASAKSNIREKWETITVDIKASQAIPVFIHKVGDPQEKRYYTVKI